MVPLLHEHIIPVGSSEFIFDLIAEARGLSNHTHAVVDLTSEGDVQAEQQAPPEADRPPIVVDVD